MADILFSHSYFMRLDPKQWRMQQPYPPLGTLFAAALLRENNYSVELFDTMFVKDPEEVLEQLEDEAPKYFIIYDDGFNYLTKMCLTNMREAALAMAKMAKEYGSKVIVCSSDATDHFEYYLESGVDVVIMGEGEISLLETINALQKDSELNSIAGIAFKEKNEVIKTDKRPVITALDDLPQPAWDLVDMEAYQKRWIKSSGYFSLNYATTRGCPFKCNWCAKPIYGNRYNSHSPERVVQDLKHLKEKYNFDYIWFCDDIFGLKPGWVQQFADLVEQENLDLKFKIQSRADLLVKDDTAAALARAGADEVWIGAESGSQKILDAMDKGTTVEQIYKATKLLRQHRIKPCFFLQFGYPGETKKDINATLKMLFDLMPFNIGISVSYPLPGTKFYENVKEDLKEKANWTDSDELALMFRSTYSPQFYKKLQRYVHHLFRQRQGLDAIKEVMTGHQNLDKALIRKVVASAWYVPVIAVDKLQLQINR